MGNTQGSPGQGGAPHKRDRSATPQETAALSKSRTSPRDLREMFMYGVEYETFIKSKTLQEAQQNVTTEEFGVCAPNKIISYDQKKEDNIRTYALSYRQAIQEMLDNTFMYEGSKAHIMCPLDQSGKLQLPFSKWAVTYDQSVTTDGDQDVPFYKRVDDLLSTTPPQVEKKELVEYVEFVSPPIKRADLSDIKGKLDKMRSARFELYNNKKTSNHIHFSCGKHFGDPNVLLNVYLLWLIVEPLILLVVPYWRRNNGYASSLYDNIKESTKRDPNEVYKQLLSLSRLSDGKELYELFKLTPDHFTRADAQNVSKKQRIDAPEFNTRNMLTQKKIPFKVIISIFQTYIGKPNERGELVNKQNQSRYSALNALNLLKFGSDARTIEVRLKHGSDDADELCEYIDFFTELFIVAILKRDVDVPFQLTESEIASIIQFHEQVSSKTTFGHLDDEAFKAMVDPLLQILDKYVFPTPNHEQAKVRKWLESQINKMHQLDRRMQPSAQEGGGRAIKQWVFCYGSNGLKQLRDRVDHKGDWEYRPVVLKDHVRIFADWSDHWAGGVASVWHAPGKRVYGMIVKLNKTELKKLDRYEGVGVSGWYVQEKATVYDVHTKEPYNAILYFKENMEMTNLPSIKYLQSIEEMLKLSGLKKQQIGKGIRVYGVVGEDATDAKEVGFWNYGDAKITVKKKYAKMLGVKM